MANAGDAEPASMDLDAESEERCLLCGFGGELVVCEFGGCTKVYHQYCLGAFPYPKSEDAIWYCPRHTCASTGATEYTPSFDLPATKCGESRAVLWKCIKCPLALSDDALPQVSRLLPGGSYLFLSSSSASRWRV